MKFHALDPVHILATIGTLRDRIRERFPTANLGLVADELFGIARSHAERSARIREPNWFLRSVSVTLVIASLATIVVLLASVRLRVNDEWQLSEAVQTLEAGLSMLFFLGAGAVFTLSLDQRSKRSRCLMALHELRAMAHIVDMHQLTKDPDRLMQAGPDTASSPPRSLSHFQMARYLDYCSEMLSLMGKVAALYVQDFPDPVAVSAVDDIEDLTTGLSSKIWQKIMVLEQAPKHSDPAGTTPAVTVPQEQP